MINSRAQQGTFYDGNSVPYFMTSSFSDMISLSEWRTCFIKKI